MGKKSPAKPLQETLIYARKFDNVIQKEVITTSLDTMLKNNDILVTNIIFSFLSDKCDYCNKIIINPQTLDNKHICNKCINYYVYCAKDSCRILVYSPKWNDRCSHCLAWYCCDHKVGEGEKCYCTRSWCCRFLDKIKF